ncbi:hypothetical protein FRC00_005719 [Tulasnella sp. 408]|nr:hypothetical protein FRC00_005719 [Tulasnella sp. 408]
MEQAHSLLEIIAIGAFDYVGPIAKGALDLFQQISINLLVRIYIFRHRAEERYRVLKSLLIDSSEELTSCLDLAEQSVRIGDERIDPSIFLPLLRIKDAFPYPQTEDLVYDSPEQQGEYESAYGKLMEGFDRLESALPVVLRLSDQAANPADPSPT